MSATTTKAERDARLFWCEEHNHWFVGKKGCPQASKGLENVDTD